MIRPHPFTHLPHPHHQPCIPYIIANSASRSYKSPHPLTPPRFYRGSLIRKQLGSFHSARDHVVEHVPSTHEKAGKPNLSFKAFTSSPVLMDTVETVAGLEMPTKEKRDTFSFRIHRPVEHMHAVNTHMHTLPR